MKQILDENKDSPFVTNDGYLVSEFFCNPLKVKSEINKAGDLDE